jgi:hypothetical protein
VGVLSDACSAWRAAKKAWTSRCRGAVRQGAAPDREENINVLILSDRGVNRDSQPYPSLLAVSGLHHYLIREGLRTRVSLVIETGEAREVHHFALLIGYGCSASTRTSRSRRSTA